MRRGSTVIDAAPATRAAAADARVSLRPIAEKRIHGRASGFHYRCFRVEVDPLEFPSTWNPGRQCRHQNAPPA